METFAELPSSLIGTLEVSHSAFVRALDEAKSIVVFEDLWTPNTMGG